MSTAAADLDVLALRAQFPILSREVRGKPLIYLDNAATTQKPEAVLRALDGYYRLNNANVHRAVHELSQVATEAFDAARTTVAKFLNAKSDREVIFTRGCTEAINLVANTWGSDVLGEGDEILISGMEHHSNIVPWQMLAARTGAVIRVMPLLDDGSLDLEGTRELLNERTVLVCVVHASNALGTVNPVKQLAAWAHEVDARILVDGAQALSHLPVDVQDLDVDFYTFSGHKVYAPTGIGGLWARYELLDEMSPWMGGGDMIETVSFSGTTFAKPPSKFEAGTPNIGGAIALGAALEWYSALDLPAVHAHEATLLAHGTALLNDIAGVRLIGTAPHKVGVLGFVVEGANAQDVGTLLDMHGVAVRTGHHCAQPVMERFGVTATARASLALYNTTDELDRFAQALRSVVTMLS